MKKRVLSLLLALWMVLTLCVPAFASAPASVEEVIAAGGYGQSAARGMLELINDFRTGEDAWYWNMDDTTKTVLTDLGELTYDYDLEQIAMLRAAELVLNFSHTRPNGEPCFTASVNGTHSWAENIAFGFSTAESVFTGWAEADQPYAGQGHRRNMLDGDYTAIGIAGFRYGGIWYWVQEFGYTVSDTPETEPDDGALAPIHPFQDISESKWYYESVVMAYRAGIVKGVSDDTFGPNDSATRGQIVTMLYRLAGEPAVAADSGFTDLKADYYKSAVAWAWSGGIVNGVSSTSFAPGVNITREQLAAMLYRMAGEPQSGMADLSGFSDAGSVSSYAADAMRWAVGAGIIAGDTVGTLRPTGDATRAEVCAMLMRFLAYLW